VIEYQLTAQELREELPVEWTAATVGLRRGNEEAVFFCPFHQDQAHPNLTTYQGRDGCFRYHCFNCGEQGDALDMLMKVGQLRWGEAITTANSLLRAGEQAGLLKPVAEDVSTGPDAVAYAQARDALKPYLGGGLLPHAYGGFPDCATEARRARMDHHLAERWGWALDGDGRVLIPHWDERGVLEAIKARKADRARSWRCYGRPQGLYGRWLQQRGPTVVLLEGESDTVTADELLQGLPVDARGLAKGAGHGAAHADAAAVAQWNRVIIALDVDEAGLRAVAAWERALADAGRVGQVDFHILQFNRGQDLRDFELLHPGGFRHRVEYLIGSGSE